MRRLPFREHPGPPSDNEVAESLCRGGDPPAVIRSALEDALRARPGYIEDLSVTRQIPAATLPWTTKPSELPGSSGVKQDDDGEQCTASQPFGGWGSWP